jgi:hypothetical protein
MRKQKQTTTRTCLGECSTQKWLSSKRTRPKTVMLTLQRTTNGYTIKDATILKPVNQHSSVSVSADVRSITNDINNKGIVTI